MRLPPPLLLALGLLMGASSAFAADAPGGACRDDAKKFCASVQPGGGRVMACLKDKQTELSPACQTALPVMERCAQEVKSACGAAGKRGMRECLRAPSDKISPECRSLAPQR
jgi:hypothetical protein